MENIYIDVKEFQKQGYKPLVDFETWRVAILKFCDDLRVENLKTMQRHMETDEVFVLLNGTCTLVSGGNGEKPGEITVLSMNQNKLYNVKKGVWHTHTLSKDAEVLIVENQNTCDGNSPTEKLNQEQIGKLRDLI